MLTAGTVWCALATYMLMLVAFRYAKHRAFHVPVMIFIILFDVCMPFYLYLNKDWHRRLIVEGELLTSLVLWAHVILLIMLYVLYIVQVRTAIRLLRGDSSVRASHREQALGVLMVRGVVIMTGALLVE